MSSSLGMRKKGSEERMEGGKKGEKEAGKEFPGKKGKEGRNISTGWQL